MPDTPFHCQSGQPIEHPCVWHSADLPARDDWQISFTDEERREFEQLTVDLKSQIPLLEKRFRRIRDSLEQGAGATWLQGFPLDNLPAECVEPIYRRLMGCVGTLVSQSADGATLYHVQDEGFGRDDPRTRGPNTSRQLSFHTDRCDVIGFLCVQPALSGGDNEIVSSAAVYNFIHAHRPDLLRVLEQPYLYQRHNVDTGNPLQHCRQPVFSFCEGHFAASFLRVLIERAYADPATEPMSTIQREALDYLEEVAERDEFRVRFRQSPGDIVLLNNWVTLHRRLAFTDHPAPERRRHLLRAWLSVPNSRPLDPLFRDNFGATEPGAIRGGMKPLKHPPHGNSR
ncbi:MAG: TauD/TfdA family dioxygenase [Planctomycetales bacterium]|nr:TauD/TfdA family dioxygenase [Planctomycetales bacterium]